MSKYWSDIVREIEPYTPGEQPRGMKLIKLNTNENPYPPSVRAIEAMKRTAGGEIRLYPDPNCSELREAVSRYYGLEKEQVFAGNGSDEVLAFSFMAFFNPDSTILFPDVTYSFYPVYSQLFHIDYRLVPLNEDFSIPIESFYERNGGIIFPNPNAPTAKYLPLESIKKILDHNMDSVVIVDEAYIAFGGESAVKLIKNYPNLLVIQTLSKSHSLAGLRLGLALGNEDLIEAMNRVKNSFNSYTVDRIALAGAAEAVMDEAYFRETRMKVMNTRERVSSELKKLGFVMTDSMANFLFISHPKVNASLIFKQLREKGILVRYFNLPRIDNYLRVTIGTDEEMDSLLQAMKEIVPF